MGARGKKRKRANGSIAIGQQRPAYAPLRSGLDEPVDEVPAEAIRAIMPFMVSDPELTDAELEANDPDYRDALDKISAMYDIADDALEFRGMRLGYILENLRPDLLRKSPDGTLFTDSRLIDFIATFDPRDTDGMIKWVNDELPPQS